MIQLSIGPGPAGTQIVTGNTDNPVSVLIQNVDSANTLYIGEDSAVNITNPLENTPILPGQSIVATGEIDVYAIAAPGQHVSINVLKGFGSFFQPTSLSALGGAAIYNTVTAPTQPPTIPPNSLWFAPDGSIQVWNGTTWIKETFSGAQIITANTITVSQLAAGIIYAGIIDGTLIQGAQMRIKNAFGATTFTINISAGTWIQYVDTGSATQGYLLASSALTAFADEFGYSVVAGLAAYENAGSGNFLAIEMLNGNLNFLNASSSAGPWNIYSSIEPNAVFGFVAYFDNPGNFYNVGHREISANNNQQITSTGNTPVTNADVSNLLATSYHITWDIFYTGDQAAGTPFFNLTLNLGAVAAFNYQEFYFPTSNSVTTRINSTVGSFNTRQQGPTLVTSVAHARIEAWFTLSTGGNVGLSAAVGTAGDTFHVNTVFVRVEKRS